MTAALQTDLARIADAIGEAFAASILTYEALEVGDYDQAAAQAARAEREAERARDLFGLLEHDLRGRRAA